MKRWVWVVPVLVAVLAVNACGGGGDSQAAKAKACPSGWEYNKKQGSCIAPDEAGTSTPATAAPFTTPPANQVGQQVSNGGITLTVTSAESAPSIRLNESNFRPGSGYETYTDTPAGPGAKYVIIKTHIVNNAKTSLDLTCGYPIKTVLVDEQQRNFDPIQDLYKVEGNPECNSQLQPGFDSDMTYPYRVPESTHVRGWAFVDETEMLGNTNATKVLLQVPGA
jgi:hypothetical protein